MMRELDAAKWVGKVERGRREVGIGRWQNRLVRERTCGPPSGSFFETDSYQRQQANSSRAARFAAGGRQPGNPPPRKSSILSRLLFDSTTNLIHPTGRKLGKLPKGGLSGLRNGLVLSFGDVVV